MNRLQFSSACSLRIFLLLMHLIMISCEHSEATPPPPPPPLLMQQILSMSMSQPGGKFFSRRAKEPPRQHTTACLYATSIQS